MCEVKKYYMSQHTWSGYMKLDHAINEARYINVLQYFPPGGTGNQKHVASRMQ